MFDEHEGKRRELSAELAALERQLASLTLAAPQIDRDRLMFAAGQAAASAAEARRQVEVVVAEATPQCGRDGRSRRGRRGSWFWPAATATMTAATLLLATMLVWREPAPVVAPQLSSGSSNTLPLPPENTPPLPLGEGRGEGAFAIASLSPASPLNDWRPVPPATSGYLSVRYIALTHGVAALDHFVPTTGADDSNARERRPPATARELLDELLPRSGELTQARS